jgi:putative membrane protein
MPFLLLLLIIVVVIILARRSERGSWTGTGNWTESHESSALRILRERYARGEITKEQYDQMRRDLMD